MKLNFSDVSTFGPLPDDRVYLAEIIKSTWTTVKSGPNQGKPAWQFDVKIINETDVPEAEGRQLFNTQSLDEKSLWKVMEVVNALGEEVTVESTDWDLEPDNYLGQQIGVIVDNQAYQGEDRAYPKKYVSPQYAGYALNDPALTGLVEEEVPA